MSVTRSTSAQRTKERLRARWFGGETGWQETAWLVAASSVVVIGLLLVFQAKTHSFPDIEQRLEKKQLLNLNEATTREEVARYLDIFANLSDRQFAAQRIYDYLKGDDSQEGRRRVLPNVGTLAKIRLTEGEIDSRPDLDSFRQRLAALRARRANTPHTQELTLPLLTSAQLSQIKPSLVVRKPQEFSRLFVVYLALYLLSFYTVCIVWRVRGLRVDGLILPVIFLLTGVGLILMISLRDALRDMTSFTDFSQGVIGGCALMLLVSFPNYQRSTLRKLSYVPLLLSFFLSTVLILFGKGPGTSDAKVNLFGFQPVEAIKILLVLFLAGYFASQWEFLRELRAKSSRFSMILRRMSVPRLEYVLPVIISIGLGLVFFSLQKDLGPALVISCLFLVLYGVARSRAVMVVFGLVMMATGFWIGYLLALPRTVVERVQMWLSPWDNTIRGGDQLAHSLWAMATGGLSGTGLGLGDPGIVPAAHTDLIHSAIGEEMGFMGLLAVFLLYVVLIHRGLRIALKAQGDYTFFLALGLTMLTALQVLILSGGILGLVPLSGVVSPFLSYGRSSMLANFIIFGILLSISARPGEKEQSAPFQRSVKYLSIGVSLIAAIVLFKAAYVQLYRSDEIIIASTLTVQADGARRYQNNPRFREVARLVSRGSVYDRNGIPLATSRWDEMEANRQQYERLGIYIDQVSSRLESRHYPFGPEMFHLLGDWRTQLNWAARNTSFVERDSNVRLQGYDDRARVVEVKDPATGETAHVIKRDYQELIPLLRYRYQSDNEEVRRILSRNRDVRMSIDIRLQLRVAQILRNHIRRAGQEKGAAIVFDPETGDLLASIGYPWPDAIAFTADSDEEAESADDSSLDRARYGLYPPGSTFKIVTAIAALRRDPSLTRDTFDCRRLPDGRVGNFIRGWGHPIRDDVADRSPHGTVNMERGILVSCNAYFAQLGTYRVGPNALHQAAELLGIAVARPNTPEQLRDALPQAAFGQGQVVATPFQMARVAATIANGGRMPYGRWITDESNQRTEQPVFILNQELASTVARFMRGVVTGGTGRRLRNSDIPIAGKTGTAEVEDAPSHAWFIGFAPYGNARRRIAFSVLIENGRYGGTEAAMAAGEIVAAARDLGIIR